MNQKFFSITLAALLLMQCSWGKPTSENLIDKSSEESNENQISSRDGNTANSSSTESEEVKFMINLVMTHFSELVDFSLTSGKKLLKDVLDDLRNIEDKSDGIKTKIEEFAKFEAELNKVDQSKKNILGEKLGLLVDLDNLLDGNTTRTDKLSEEDAFIENSLKAHGMEAIEKEFEEKFLIICDKLYKAVADYWDSLDPEAKKKTDRLDEWLKTFKKETDFQKKIELFGDILLLDE